MFHCDNFNMHITCFNYNHPDYPLFCSLYFIMSYPLCVCVFVYVFAHSHEVCTCVYLYMFTFVYIYAYVWRSKHSFMCHSSCFFHHFFLRQVQVLAWKSLVRLGYCPAVPRDSVVSAVPVNINHHTQLFNMGYRDLTLVIMPVWKLFHQLSDLLRVVISFTWFHLIFSWWRATAHSVGTLGIILSIFNLPWCIFQWHDRSSVLAWELCQTVLGSLHLF